MSAGPSNAVSVALRSGLIGLLVLAQIATEALAATASFRSPGAGEVSAMGEALYSIPIEMPAGTQGLTPRLALVYGHRRGDGAAGQGWSVAGLSAISRCERTWAQDGESRGVKLDLLDRFCLDGNKLRLTSGTYGVAGSTYQSEIETFSRVTAYGAAGNGPAHFIVERKDGSIYEYGNTADSRIEAKGVAHVRTWAISKIRDRSGNEILFNYTEDATYGSFRINTVQYTGNPGQGVAAPYTVSFTYETKPVGEIDAWYRAGSLIKVVTRLQKATVTHNGAETWRYTMSYEPYLSNAGRSRLQSVLTTGVGVFNGYPSENSFYQPTFTYQNGQPGLSAATSTGTSIPTPNDALALDVNGDGRTDYLYSSSVTSGAGTWRVMYANASGGLDAPVDTGFSNANFQEAIPIDYNADGIEDVLVPYSGGIWWVMLGSSTGLTAPMDTGAPDVSSPGNASAFDFTGDGLDDLVWAVFVGYGQDYVLGRAREWGGGFAATTTELLAPGVIGYWTTPVWGNRLFRGRTRAPDFDADGREDFTFIAGGQLEAVLSGGGVMTANAIGNAGGGPWILDINGDGYTDLAMLANGSVRALISDGKSFPAVPIETQAPAYSWGRQLRCSTGTGMAVTIC